MANRKKTLVKVERQFVPHLMLLDAASRSLETGKTKETGYWWDWLSSILFSALSIEAIGNCYGETLIPRWQDFEKTSPVGKLRLVAEACGAKPDFKAKPWSIAPELIRFRNLIAHAKLQDITIESTHPLEGYEKHLYEKPLSKLEGMVTKEFAEQSKDAVRKILELLSDGIPQKNLAHLRVEMWHGIASTVETPD